MHIYPFFIECSKYANQPWKQKLFQKMAFGYGIHIISRKDKNVVVMGEHEFIIPHVYSDSSRKEFEKKLWNNEQFTNLGEEIKLNRKTWQTTRKKDKIHLLDKYVSKLENITLLEKKIICNLLILALSLKFFKVSDIVYEDFIIKYINPNLFNKETFTNLNFVYDYSISTLKSTDNTFNSNVTNDEDG